MQSVCIMLNGEESELRFMNEREMSVNIALTYFFVIYLHRYGNYI